MGFQKRIEGNESIYNESTDCFTYTTNFGQLSVARKTGVITYACLGFQIPSEHEEICVKFIDDEFQVYISDMYGNSRCELNSPKYPYKNTGTPTLKVEHVLLMLQEDPNYSDAAIIAKKALVAGMWKHLKLGKRDKQTLDNILHEWKQPIRVFRKAIKER